MTSRELGDWASFLGPEQFEKLRGRKHADILMSILNLANIKVAVMSTTWELTELGNARLFEYLFGGLVCYVVGSGWHVFDHRKRVWVSDPGQELVHYLACFISALRRGWCVHVDDKSAWGFAARSATYHAQANLLKVARSFPSLLEDRARFDTQLDEVLDASGIVHNLQTGDYRQSGPEDRWTKSLGVRFDPLAKSPLWESFLEQVLPDPEVRNFLRIYFGYILTGRTSAHLLVLFYGSGANGKSVVVAVLRYILGEFAMTLSNELLVPKSGRVPPHEKAMLEGLRLAVFSETQEGARLNESGLKDITSEDAIEACRKYEAPFNFKPTHKPVLMTNHIPRVRSIDEGIWRRLRVLLFPVTIPENQRDQNLTEKLLGESAGIFNWALSGAREWYANGLPNPDAISGKTKEYRRSEDTFLDFIDEQQTAPNLTAASEPLYQAYRAWSERLGLKPETARGFKDLMNKHGFADKRTTRGKVFVGIGIGTNEDAPLATFSTNSIQYSSPEEFGGNVGLLTSQAESTETDQDQLSRMLD